MCPAFDVAVLRSDSGFTSMCFIGTHIHLHFRVYQILTKHSFEVKTRERQVLHELGEDYQSGNLN